jgi:hypothetical protein
MTGLGVELEIDVCVLAVHFLAQGAIRSPVNIYVQEEKCPSLSVSMVK